MSDQYEEAEEKLQDWLGYKHIIKRIKFSRQKPKVTFHFDNGLRVGLYFNNTEKTFTGSVELSQFHNQFGSEIQVTKDDVRAVRFMHRVLIGEAKPLIFKCEEEIQKIWSD